MEDRRERELGGGGRGGGGGGGERGNKVRIGWRSLEFCRLRMYTCIYKYMKL